MVFTRVGLEVNKAPTTKIFMQTNFTIFHIVISSSDIDFTLAVISRWNLFYISSCNPFQISNAAAVWLLLLMVEFLESWEIAVLGCLGLCGLYSAECLCLFLSLHCIRLVF